MKRALGIIIGVVVLILAILFGRYGIHIFYRSSGYVEIRDKNFDDLNINRSAVLNNVSAIHNIFVVGSLSGDRVNAGEVHVGGAATVSNTLVSGRITVFGLFDAYTSTFNEIVAYERVMLKNSTAKSITIELPVVKRRQCVELVDTMVAGDIIFKAGGGDVVLRGNSGVIVGKIIGATIQKK